MSRIDSSKDRSHSYASSHPSPADPLTLTIAHKPHNDTFDTNMQDQLPGKNHRSKHWTLADIDWQAIDHDMARRNVTTYYVITAASFVETAADLYTANLVEHFTDPTARYWLSNYWQPEELQHGLALRTYVETVWPEFDWPTHYHNFFAEYSQLCTMEELETSRALEMVARCVVEAGTSTFYTAVQNSSDEPILKKLTGLIKQDEVSHYNHFRRFFKAYQKHEHIGRLGVVRSLYKRLTEVENEDAYIGLKHAWLMRHPNKAFDKTQFDSLLQELRPMLSGHYPYRMALKMLLKPLSLNRTVVKLAMPLLEQAARRLMFKS